MRYLVQQYKTAAAFLADCKIGSMGLKSFKIETVIREKVLKENMLAPLKKTDHKRSSLSTRQPCLIETKTSYL